MPTLEVVLLDARSVAAAIPDRWWVPSDEDLEAIMPGRSLVKVLAAPREPDGGARLSSAASLWIAVEERPESKLAGTIVMSAADWDRYREGDELEAEVTQVFDIAHLDDEGRPQLNEPRAQFTLGKRVLVGITVLSSEGSIVDQRQILGELTAVDPLEGLELRLEDGSSYWLPPDVRPFEEAPPGEYRLRSTGVVVRDPDYTCTWTITRPPGASTAPPPTGFRFPPTK